MRCYICGKEIEKIGKRYMKWKDGGSVEICRDCFMVEAKKNTCRCEK